MISMRDRKKVLHAVLTKQSAMPNKFFPADNIFYIAAKVSNYVEILFVLEAMGLVYLSNSRDGKLTVKATPDGLSFFERHADELRSTLLRSVLLPIFVAFVTTITTNYALPWIISKLF